VFTVLGFSMGFLALGAVVAVVEVLMTVLAIAFCIYASLALIGVVVFSVIGIRRVLARRQSGHGQPPMTQLQRVYNQAGRYP
jgi:UDP-N-acetylmuramyl pentapeptide phosphotransferase/UDP-N-acetylglucosamine-1-phosphate transferase